MTKQVLSIEQMQHLQEMGLELDYDTLYSYVKFEDTDWLLKPSIDLSIIGISFKYIPSYTLQDVLDALPEEVKYKRKDYLIEMWKRDNEWTIGYLSFSEDDTLDVLHLHDETNKSFIDAAYEMLCWCIENGYGKIGKEDK